MIELIVAYRDQDKFVQEANKDNDYLLEKWEGEKSWKNKKQS